MVNFLVPRRHRSLIYKLLILIPILWLTLAFVMLNDKNHGAQINMADKGHENDAQKDAIEDVPQEMRAEGQRAAGGLIKAAEGQRRREQRRRRDQPRRSGMAAPRAENAVEDQHDQNREIALTAVQRRQIGAP